MVLHAVEQKTSPNKEQKLTYLVQLGMDHLGKVCEASTYTQDKKSKNGNIV